MKGSELIRCELLPWQEWTKPEPEDTERDSGAIAAVVSDGRAEAQAKAVRPSPGVARLSLKVGRSGAGSSGGGAGALEQCRPPGEL